MNEIAKHSLSITDFGLKMRLFSGAGLSVFDIISDVYMIVVFLGSEETRGVAHVNIVCVALSLLMQLVLVWFVNRKRSWRRIAREVLYVVAFCKPGIDAARVVAGNESDDGLAAMTPLQELFTGKASEMVFESIPAGTCANHRHQGFALNQPLSPSNARSNHPDPGLHHQREAEQSRPREHHHQLLHHGLRGRHDVVRLRHVAREPEGATKARRRNT
jgi:hypothetical protein